MSAYVIGIYDIVRRMCADHAFGAHATDVALQAVEEGLVEGTTLEGIIFEVRFALDYLRAHGIIEIQRFAANTFVVKEDLLTVMSKVL